MSTQPDTPQTVLDSGDLNRIPAVMQGMKLGTMLTPLKRAFTGLTAAAAIDLTANDGTGETVGPSNANRLAALSVTALRVTAGAATAGPRIVSDSGATPGAPGANGPGIATLSDDGKTVTFEGNVTGFVIEYIPRASVSMTTAKFGVAPGSG